MITVDFTPGPAASVLRMAADQRTAYVAANAVAQSFRADVLDYLTTRARFRATKGALRSSVRWRPLASGANVQASGPAEFMERGTPPHSIVPKGSSVLRFKAGGRLVFARRVDHPGTRPAPFFFTELDARLGRGEASALRAVAARLQRAR